MQNINYIEIFNKASELMDGIDYLTVKKDSKYLKKQEEEIFKLYFEEAVLNTVVNLQGHNRSMYDGKTIKEIKESFEYEYLTERYLDQVKFVILHDLFIPILESQSELLMDSDFSLRDNILSLFKDTLNSPYFTVEHNCFVCGVNTRSYYHNGQFTNIVDENSRMFKSASHKPCSHKNGIGKYDFKINIPSGKLVIANDLRKLFSREICTSLADQYIIDKSGYYNSICSQLGRYYTQEYWNDLGLIYVTMGNCSPYVFQDSVTKNLTFKSDYIYCPQNDRDSIEYDDDKNYIKNYTETEVKLGQVITDLWAVCAIDLDLMKALSGEKNIDCKNILDDALIVDIEPGEYIVRSFYDDIETTEAIFEIVKS